MADGWLGISSTELDSYCGAYEGYEPDGALDGSSVWYHFADEVHWLILDLGETYTIKKVSGRSEQGGMDPMDVDIYVSDDKGSWGSAVATGINTWLDTDVLQEVDTTDKDGRYIKIVINDTEHGGRDLGWGTDPAATIFDAYGDVVAAEGWTNIKNIRVGTGSITATDLSHIWFGTTPVAVADVAEFGGVAV